jgi:hypothetical protein
MGSLTPEEVDRVLAEALAAPLSAAERAELDERLRLLGEHVRRVREHFLEEEEPAVPLSLESRG